MLHQLPVEDQFGFSLIQQLQLKFWEAVPKFPEAFSQLRGAPTLSSTHIWCVHPLCTDFAEEKEVPYMSCRCVLPRCAIFQSLFDYA